MSTSGEGSNNATAKRKRGRTPGSKNRSKFPVATSTPDAGTIHTHVLNIPAGGDVAETVAAFARGCRNFGVCVLSASGPIVAAVFWEASPYPSTLTFQGSFDLVSMTATFLPGESEGSLAVTLAGSQGQVVGGVVAGPVVAAGTVIVVAATYSSSAFHSFDALNSSSASTFSVIGGEEASGKSLPMEKCNEGTIEQVDGPSVVVEGGRPETWNGDALEMCVDKIEQHLGLREAVAGDFSGATVIGGDKGEQEVDEQKLEHYVKDLQQCLEFSAETDGASCGRDVGEVEMQDFADAFVIGGSDGGNMYERYYDSPTVFDSGFRSGRNGCIEHFAFDPFSVCGACPPLY